MRYRRCPDVAVVRQDSRLFIATTQGDVQVLNPNAAVIWECVESTTADETSNRVADRVGLPATDVADDTLTVLESLRTAGLLIAD